MRKLKLISDGRLWNTKLVDAETGEMIANVISVEWRLSRENNDHLAVATVVIEEMPVELTGPIDLLRPINPR